MRSDFSLNLSPRVWPMVPCGIAIDSDPLRQVEQSQRGSALKGVSYRSEKDESVLRGR